MQSVHKISEKKDTVCLSHSDRVHNSNESNEYNYTTTMIIKKKFKL